MRRTVVVAFDPLLSAPELGEKGLHGLGVVVDQVEELLVLLVDRFVSGGDRVELPSNRAKGCWRPEVGGKRFGLFDALVSATKG